MIDIKLRKIEISSRRRVPFEVSVREKPRGGGVLPVPDERPDRLFANGRRILLLIHGFNVTLCSAGCSFDRFKDLLDLQWSSRAVAVYWPGDAEMATSESRFKRTASQVVSVLSYSFQIDRAEETARVLRDHIVKKTEGRKPPLELSIVAHSLGCRVALHLVDHLIASSTVKLKLMVLMAAAVPVYYVRARRRLRGALEKPDKVIIYHSIDDRVLAAAFRPGQLVEVPFPHGFSDRHALGRQGLDRDLPKQVEQIPTNNDHGDYWHDHSIAERVTTELDNRLTPRDWFKPLQLRRLAGGRTLEFREIQLRPLSSATGGLRTGCSAC